MRILLIDDNPQIRMVVLRVLAALGHEAEEAESGPEGLARLESEAFDLALIDIEMPDMDGFAVARAAKSKTKAQLYALSAHPFDRNREELDAAGFSGSVEKPVSAAALVALLQSHETSSKNEL